MNQSDVEPNPIQAFGHPTISLVAIPWPTYQIPDIIQCLCISTVSLINLLSSGLPYNPQNIHDPLSTLGHKTSSSIIIIIITVDHLVRSRRTVQYRGRGYSNRFLHSAEVAHFTHTMELLVPYLGTLPSRVDRCCSNKTCLTHDSSIVPPTIVPSQGHVL